MSTQRAQQPLRAEDLQVADTRLRLWHLEQKPTEGTESRPRVLILHGMRDVSRSLLPVAEPLAQTHAVTLLDQRGHGASDYTGAYSIEHFYYDLHSVIRHLQGADQTPVTLIGHSLGGQICARFAGLFPELIARLVLVEGLGPPEPNWQPGLARAPQEIEQYRAALLQRLSIPARMRPLADRAFAAERLLANNPRLTPERAAFIAGVATREIDNGKNGTELHWAFDPRVASAFVGFSLADSERLWRAVRCPVLTITGDHADEYWRTAVLQDGFTGRFQDGEYAARIAHFQQIEHDSFAGSGHMVHFDEPEHLASRVQAFLVGTATAGR